MFRWENYSMGMTELTGFMYIGVQFGIFRSGLISTSFGQPHIFIRKRERHNRSEVPK